MRRAGRDDECTNNFSRKLWTGPHGIGLCVRRWENNIKVNLKRVREYRLKQDVFFNAVINLWVPQRMLSLLTRLTTVTPSYSSVLIYEVGRCHSMCAKINANSSVILLSGKPL
jgi:hypothetical protein